MMVKNNKVKIAQNFVDRDGWLTDAVAEGGKKRLEIHVGRHGFRKPPRDGNPKTSDEAFAEIAADPSGTAVVIAGPVEAPEGRRGNAEPDACVLASACDAAGLIGKGRRIVCLTLADHEFTAAIDGDRAGRYWRGDDRYDLYGSTAGKHDEIARRLVDAGAELVAAPAGWDGGEPRCRVVGWVPSGWNDCEYAVIETGRRGPYGVNRAFARMLPVLDADTETLRRIASSFAGDEAEKSRKEALAGARDVFKGLELGPEEVVELLSYGMVEWTEAKARSYKVPAWKRALLRPTAERLSDFNGGQGQDAVAGKLSACERIWRASLGAYGVSFKPGRAAPAEIVRAWKEIGAAMGVDSSVEAVLVHGIPVDDVLASI